ncbi:MAG: PKD domain-containing protein [Patescibacteria group bacterium]
MKTKITFFLLAIVVVVLWSCTKEYDQIPNAPIQAVLTISQGLKSTSAQGDTCIRNRVITFSGEKSTGPIRSYMFTFGDGTGTQFVNITNNNQIFTTHTLIQNGQYDVVLTVYAGPNGTGAQDVKHKTVWIVDSITPPPHPSHTGDILQLLDSTWNANTQEWTCNFKLDVDRVFFQGCAGPFFYKGDQNSWGATPLPGTLIDGWYHFTVTAGKYGHRFTVIIYNDTSEIWATISVDVHQNEISISIWNVYGCFEVIGLPTRITPAYTPGLRGDQQVSLEPAGVGYTRINIKDLNFRWTSVTPGILFLKQSGWVAPIALTPDPNDPYGRWSYTVVNNADFFWSGNPYNGVCFFQLLPDYTSTTFAHIWTGSYFYYAGNPANNPPIPACFSFQTTIF